MDNNDVIGAQLAVAFLADYITTVGATTFRRWAKSQKPERWREWAEAQRKGEDDDALVLDAVLAFQAAVLDASRAHLDRLVAVWQAREITGL